MKLKNKTVLILDGTSGTGFMMIKSFLKVGAKVLICGEDAEKLNAINRFYPKIKTYKCDVLNPLELDAMIKDIGGQIDIWLNNSKIFQNYLPYMDKVQNSNLENHLVFNYFFNIVKIIPHLKKKEEAAIINMTYLQESNSTFADRANSILKSAFFSFNNGLRHYLQDTNIKIFEISTSMFMEDYDKDLEIQNLFVENADCSKAQGHKNKMAIA